MFTKTCVCLLGACASFVEVERPKEHETAKVELRLSNPVSYDFFVPVSDVYVSALGEFLYCIMLVLCEQYLLNT